MIRSVRVVKMPYDPSESEHLVYVGRNFDPDKFGEETVDLSELGNPYKLKQGHTPQERMQVVKAYRKYIADIIADANETDERYAAMEYLLKLDDLDVDLCIGCHCHPLPCHADAIADALQYLLLVKRHQQ